MSGDSGRPSLYAKSFAVVLYTPLQAYSFGRTSRLRSNVSAIHLKFGSPSRCKTRNSDSRFLANWEEVAANTQTRRRSLGTLDLSLIPRNCPQEVACRRAIQSKTPMAGNHSQPRVSRECASLHALPPEVSTSLVSFPHTAAPGQPGPHDFMIETGTGFPKCTTISTFSLSAF